MKLTLKTFFLLLVIGNFLFGAQNEYYTIRLFSVDTKNNTRTLESLRTVKIAADKLSDRLKNRAFIVREDNVFVLYATRAKSKSEALSWLKSYKRYFKDARILKQNRDQIEMIKDYTNTIAIKQPIKSITKSEPKPKPKPKPKKVVFQEPYYTIQLASVKLNGKGLNYLKNMVKKLDKELKNGVYITKGSNYYLLQALKVKDRGSLNSFLKEYKKVFKDAYILKQDYKGIKIVADYSSEKFKNLVKKLTITPKKVIAGTNKSTTKAKNEQKEQKKQEVKQDKKISSSSNSVATFTPTKDAKFTLDLINDKTFYIVRRTSKGGAMILEVTFNAFAPSTFKIHMAGSKRSKPRSGLIKRYVSPDNKLYLYFTRSDMDKTYHLLKEITEDYFIVEVWSKKKKEETVRFYYDFQKAKEYKQSLINSTQGLSKYY